VTGFVLVLVLVLVLGKESGAGCSIHRDDVLVTVMREALPRRGAM
jgi:hypothetical protein